MVIAATWALWATAIAATGAEPDPAAAIRSAHVRERFPWYDADRDAVRAVTVPRVAPAGGSTGGPVVGLAQTLVFLLMALALAALIAALVWAARRYLPAPEEIVRAEARPSRSARVEALPTGLAVDTSDPWDEARRRRAAGDYSGAIIYLFAHQLLMLDRLGAIRLAPGRTGRQLVRSIGDAQIRARVEPTLRLFEAVFYGRRPPAAEAFEAAWAEAEALEQLVAEGAIA